MCCARPACVGCAVIRELRRRRFVCTLMNDANMCVVCVWCGTCGTLCMAALKTRRRLLSFPPLRRDRVVASRGVLLLLLLLLVGIGSPTEIWVIYGLRACVTSFRQTHERTAYTLLSVFFSLFFSFCAHCIYTLWRKR